MKSVTFTAKEAAEYIGISYYTILDLVRKRQIPHTPVGRRKLFRKESLDNWMTEQEKISQESESSFGIRRVY